MVSIILAAVILRKAFASADEDAGTLPVWSLLLALVWAVGGFGLMRSVRRGPGTPLRTTREWGVIALLSGGLAAGSFVGGLVLTAYPPTSAWVTDAVSTASSAPLAITLIVALVAGAAEEIFFRIGFAGLWSGIWVWIIPNALYTIVTLATGNLALAAVAPILGLTATAAREWTHRFYAPLIVHAVWTVAMVGVFPLVAG